jgi:hypothetical protein
MKIFAIGLIGATLLTPPQTFSPDADGFIRNWLILAPIAFDVSGAAAIGHPFLDHEPAIKPKPRDSVVIINTPLTWQPHQASDDLIRASGDIPKCIHLRLSGVSLWDHQKVPSSGRGIGRGSHLTLDRSAPSSGPLPSRPIAPFCDRRTDAPIGTSAARTL